MFEPKCRRCQGKNIQKTQISVLATITPFSGSKHEIRKFIAIEEALLCQECDAFVLKSDAADKRYFSERGLKEHLVAKYKKDVGFLIELNFK